MDMPSGPNANTRVIIAFLCLFAVMIALSVGAYFAGDLGKLQERISARESQAALQGITEPAQIDEALRQYPSNKLVQMMAMATRAANETNAATEKLSSEIEPPAISKADNLGAARRNELEALRRDLKTAEANATTFMPRYVALLKTERDNVEEYALSLHLGKDTVGRLLDNVDKRHAEITAWTFPDAGGARRLLSRLRQLCRGSGPGIRRLQGREWRVHIPVSAHREPLQCRRQGHERRREAHHRLAGRKKNPVAVAAGALAAARQR
jgi:hypothetical protein